FAILPVLLERLRAEFGVAAGMSGSGSACFALPRAETDLPRMGERVREFLGARCFCVAAAVA
ncbi:MAG: 4-(cytidine 5'-diphospho)-2-C-methyl-D-erythritol kinase, partial [Opitutaceae bacterium]|nr:4-(cytidine 5'-diphospho)-2-C-methyl-D-erythritol kinase [Opitutaceae bacterium]